VSDIAGGIGGPAGTVDDVYRVRRALHALVQPRWLFAGPYLLVMMQIAIWPLACLMGLWALPVGFVAYGSWFGWWLVMARRLRKLPVRPVPVEMFSRRALLGTVGLVVALLFALLACSAVPVVLGGMRTLQILNPLLVLLCVPVIYAIMPLVWRWDPTGVNSPPLRDLPDQPATLDPLIAPREPLAVCATLAYVGQLGDDLLARTLGISTYDVSRVSAELVRAQYIYVQSDGPRWWLGLTPAGRAAYRRHLRALGA